MRFDLSTVLCLTATLAACGDTRAQPLYGAPSPIATEAGAADADDGAAHPCSTDQPLVLAATTTANVARPGALYAAPPLDPYTPRPIGVRLTTAAGAPVGGCDVAWTPAPGSGWVFPIGRSTDANGRVDAWWTAGPDASQTLRAAVMGADAGEVSITINGTAEPKRTSPARVYVQYASQTFDAFSVEVVPQVAGIDANVGALWTSSCGMGMSTDASSDGGPPTTLAFAFCWNSNADPTTVFDLATSTCGEIPGSPGSGTYCTRPYAWKVADAYRFDLETRHVVAGHTDYAFYVASVATGERVKLVELRYGGGGRPSAAYSYLQNEDFAPSCLETELESALFRNVEKTDGDVTTAIGSATFTRDYDAMQNEICANYTYGVVDRAFFISTGADRVGPPRPPGWPAPILTLP